MGNVFVNWKKKSIFLNKPFRFAFAATAYYWCHAVGESKPAAILSSPFCPPRSSLTAYAWRRRSQLLSIWERFSLAREGSDDERVSTITLGSLAESDKNRTIFGSENKFETNCFFYEFSFAQEMPFCNLLFSAETLSTIMDLGKWSR